MLEHRSGRGNHVGSASLSRRTLILETEFETPHGAVTLIDFMPIRDNGSDFVRIVVGRQGTVLMRMELVLRFDYGSCRPWVSRIADGCLRAIAGPHSTILRTPIDHRGEDMRTVAAVRSQRGRAHALRAHLPRRRISPFPNPSMPRRPCKKRTNAGGNGSVNAHTEGRWSDASFDR